MSGAIDLGPPIHPAQRVTEFYVWVVINPDGGEGVCGVSVPGFGMTLAGAASERTALIYGDMLRDVAKDGKTRLELRRFSEYSVVVERS